MLDNPLFSIPQVKIDPLFRWKLTHLSYLPYGWLRRVNSICQSWFSHCELPHPVNVLLPDIRQRPAMSVQTESSSLTNPGWYTVVSLVSWGAGVACIKIFWHSYNKHKVKLNHESNDKRPVLWYHLNKAMKNKKGTHDHIRQTKKEGRFVYDPNYIRNRRKAA